MPINKGMNQILEILNPMNMNPMMMNQITMGMNQGFNPQMNALPPWHYLNPENIKKREKIRDLDNTINMIEKQNEKFYNLINNYELKKRIIPTIEEIIHINKELILDFTEEKTDLQMTMQMIMYMHMPRKEKPKDIYKFNKFYSVNQDILKFLEEKYIDLDLEELIISQNILEGYWDGNSESKKLIQIFNKDSYENINKKIKELKIVGPTIKIIYTILAIYYLKTKFLYDYNDNKLIIEKAYKFLTKYGVNYEEFATIIKN